MNKIKPKFVMEIPMMLKQVLWLLLGMGKKNNNKKKHFYVQLVTLIRDW